MFPAPIWFCKLETPCLCRMLYVSDFFCSYYYYYIYEISLLVISNAQTTVVF